MKLWSSKVKKHVGGIGRDFGGIARNFGGIARNFGGIAWTQLSLQICTAHEHHISAELKIVGIFFCFRRIFLNSAIPVLKCNFGRSSPNDIYIYTYAYIHIQSSRRTQNMVMLKTFLILENIFKQEKTIIFYLSHNHS